MSITTHAPLCNTQFSKTVKILAVKGLIEKSYIFTLRSETFVVSQFFVYRELSNVRIVVDSLN